MPETRDFPPEREGRACQGVTMPASSQDGHSSVPAGSRDARTDVPASSKVGRLSAHPTIRSRPRPRPNSNYGRITSIALDPVEKKPLAMWHPGSYVLSVGSYGCNLRCPFCQNWEISQAGPDDVPWRFVSPEQLVGLASDARDRDPRVIGIAYTYNEPLVGWEYVRDCARLAHEAGLANVLVSNGHVSDAVVDELASLIDAANIDLKAFDSRFYTMCGGSLLRAKRTIEQLAAAPTCHLEVTTLVIPGENDSPAEMDAEATWLASLDPEIPLHVTRFFPRWHMNDRKPTPVETVRELAGVARRHLRHVFVGNC